MDDLPDGGMKNYKSPKQHVTQVCTILKMTGQQLLVSALWEHSVLNTFTTYAKEKKYLPATIRSYLNSLVHLYHLSVPLKVAVLIRFICLA